MKPLHVEHSQEILWAIYWYNRRCVFAPTVAYNPLPKIYDYCDHIKASICILADQNYHINEILRMHTSRS